jgi:DNA-binding GntR family transcriptional regulator
VSAADLWNLTTARAEIDCLCLRRSVIVGDLDWESRIVAAFHRLDNTPEYHSSDPSKFNSAFAVAHDQFQEALISACDNPWLSRMRNTLHAQAKRYRGLSEPGKHNIRKDFKRLLEACLNRDSNTAENLLSEHMLSRAKTLMKHLPAAAETAA